MKYSSAQNLDAQSAPSMPRIVFHSHNCAVVVPSCVAKSGQPSPEMDFTNLLQVLMIPD